LILYINGFAFERLYEERTPQFTTLTSNWTRYKGYSDLF
jgi:hypothetical protein